MQMMGGMKRGVVKLLVWRFRLVCVCGSVRGFCACVALVVLLPNGNFLSFVGPGASQVRLVCAAERHASNFVPDPNYAYSYVDFARRPSSQIER